MVEVWEGDIHRNAGGPWLWMCVRLERAVGRRARRPRRVKTELSKSCCSLTSREASSHRHCVTAASWSPLSSRITAWRCSHARRLSIARSPLTTCSVKRNCCSISSAGLRWTCYWCCSIRPIPQIGPFKTDIIFFGRFDVAVLVKMHKIWSVNSEENNVKC